jgi:hypothetical protein
MAPEPSVELGAIFGGKIGEAVVGSCFLEMNTTFKDLKVKLFEILEGSSLFSMGEGRDCAYSARRARNRFHGFIFQ